MHHFSLAFLERMADHMQHRAPVHQAHKTIPAPHGPVKVCYQLSDADPAACSNRISHGRCPHSWQSACS